MQTEFDTSHCQLIRQQRQHWIRRWIVAGLGASGSVSLLFLLMGWQLSHDFRYQREPNRLRFDVTLANKDESLEHRQRLLPEPPPVVEPLEPLQMVQTAPLPPKTPSLKAPKPADANFNTKVSVLANVLPGDHDTAPIQTGVTSVAIGQIQPSERAIPFYPRQASQRGIEGYVKLGFSIDEDGRAVDIQVIDAKPQRIFNRSAINALLRSRFPVTEVNGAPIVVANQVQSYEFKMEK